MTTCLEVKDLEAWYGESHVLHGVSLTVKAGETLCILGRNGMGKTTTLRAIMGILKKRTGSIRLGDTDLMTVPLHRVAKAGLGFVPEERGIFSALSVEENLMLPPMVAPGGMSLDEIYDLFPNLLERRRSQGTRLSGGEQQMLAIARILRTGATCILLDEPTEGLAPVIIERIGDVLKTLKSRGLTIVLVEQNFRFAQKVADRFCLMDHGRITEDFPVAELAQHREALARVLGV
ncbi:ABC transporter ATP-binding protein [Gemmobacter sp. 24YEA27]|uniref:ABC transporter ATP-binding protein n=1 Tax=Gemmobacter sp. 24YEA27 TaxID=3040672 RepID=UPI0024B387A3|nr:ABC transporter ATP-binding protein [Gemmobacter sp. 24YEA27]